MMEQALVGFSGDRQRSVTPAKVTGCTQSPEPEQENAAGKDTAAATILGLLCTGQSCPWNLARGQASAHSPSRGLCHWPACPGLLHLCCCHTFQACSGSDVMQNTLLRHLGNGNFITSVSTPKN